MLARVWGQAFPDTAEASWRAVSNSCHTMPVLFNPVTSVRKYALKLIINVAKNVHTWKFKATLFIIVLTLKN